MKWYIHVAFFNILLISTESAIWNSFLKTNPEKDALELAQSGNYISLQHNRLPKNIITELSLSYACPIVDSNKSEKNADSITKKSLIIQKDFLKCNTPVEPSIVEVKSNHYTIGYEVYMDTFKLLCQFNLLEKKLSQNFCWFFVIDIHFKTALLRLSCMIHILSGFGSEQTDTNLKELTLGEALFEDLDLNYLYSEKNQAKIFSETKSQYFNWNAGNRLEPQFLIDPEDFFYDSHKKAAFNYANVAPIWRNVKNRSWKLLNEKLRQMLHENDYFIIVTGTYGILQLPNEIFLAENNKIPVPYAFWKLIRFTHSTKVGNVIKTVYYDIIIVVHNHPYEENPKPICPDVCAKYDWNIFNNMNRETGYIYCCEVNPNSSHLFGIDYFWVDDPTPRDVFNLHNYETKLYMNYL